MAMLVAVQVFCRYVLNQSLFWSEELARYLLVWLTFLGASTAYRRQAHPGVDILYTRMPPKIRQGCSVLIHMVSLGLFAVMIIYGWQFAYFIRLQYSPALQLPKWIVLSIIPVSGIVLSIHGLFFLANALTLGPHDV
jgi:TRAP-type C4-dicarboxylate transport system permease small subunit